MTHKSRINGLLNKKPLKNEGSGRESASECKGFKAIRQIGQLGLCVLLSLSGMAQALSKCSWHFVQRHLAEEVG